jgi:hypothetical protein
MRCSTARKRFECHILQRRSRFGTIARNRLAGFFGDALGDPVADAILSELRHARETGRTRTQISALFGRNRAATEIEVALRFPPISGRR